MTTINTIPALIPVASMHGLFRYTHQIEKELWSRYGIKDQGSYAEHLVAEALGAQMLRNGVNKGFDLLHEHYGKIEVRSRRYPLDDRLEDRAQVPNSKTGLFNFFAHVVFDPCFNVHGAYLAPHDAISELASKSKNRYVRFSEGRSLSNSIDLTTELRAVQVKLNG